MTCKHEHGVDLDGDWICGQCFAKLHERPRTYYMEPSMRIDGEGDIGRPPRQMVRLCPVKRADSGFNLGEFILCMARRLFVRSGGTMPLHEAKAYALDLLRDDGTEFGSNDYDWGQTGAWDLVDEDMQHWEPFDGDQGND